MLRQTNIGGSGAYVCSEKCEYLSYLEFLCARRRRSAVLRNASSSPQSTFANFFSTLRPKDLYKRVGFGCDIRESFYSIVPRDIVIARRPRIMMHA